MTFSQSVGSVFVKFLDFNGRASRSEFWYFALFILIVYIFIYLLGDIFGDGNGRQMLVSILSWLIGVVLVLPTISVGVRRMHDIGKGGGWIFIWLVPVIGEIWFLILAANVGQPGPNRFGQEPR